METLFYYIAINYNGISSLFPMPLGLMDELICLYVYSFIMNFYLEVLKNPLQIVKYKVKNSENVLSSNQ